MHEVLFLIVPDGAWGVVAYWNAAFGVPRWAGLRGLGAAANVASKLGCCGGQGCEAWGAAANMAVVRAIPVASGERKRQKSR